jgi:hypothetical protein
MPGVVVTAIQSLCQPNNLTKQAANRDSIEYSQNDLPCMLRYVVIVTTYREIRKRVSWQGFSGE